MNDYFDILGVNENSSQEEIKKAYHKMLKKYHPDNYKGDVKFANEMTGKISLAYEVLSEEKLREEYIKGRSVHYEQRNDVKSHQTNYYEEDAEKRRMRRMQIFSIDQIFKFLIIMAIVICLVSCAIYFLPDEVMLFFERIRQNIDAFLSSFK